ncbi:hypothetical protein LZ318_30825 [Saccharopolyspora indica]|uniref:hypothetical protein n=1 Tax=Saccharopolyspora indica TaxID=1229659 RepID=UPI0022EB5C7C|nr:hypothetical protein [Saccharopolyspora indica]MDA3644373.1 hypothetical protein [Saccharopolyspora indica]
MPRPAAPAGARAVLAADTHRLPDRGVLDLPEDVQAVREPTAPQRNTMRHR